VTLSSLVYAPWNKDEWEKWFWHKRKYPDADDKKRSLLGKGGFASVYRMRRNAVYYAVKVLKLENLGMDSTESEKHEKEAKTMERLKHKHVIQYVGHEIQDDVKFCLIMEYASGGCLANHLGKELSKAMQLRLITEIADGLHYLHGEHVIHRDLKSSNILLSGPCDKLRVKISDFGLATQLSCSAASKVSSKGGTNLYFSPERGREDKYTYSADMWAVGCIIIEVVTGQCLKASLWPEAKRGELKTKLNTVLVQNPLLGKKAASLLQHDAEKRIDALCLYSALRQVVVDNLWSFFLIKLCDVMGRFAGTETCCHKGGRKHNKKHGYDRQGSCHWNSI
jgi:serine/threonine protein kinase